ncbi:MAG: transcriptional regulator [Spirochaetales bacterium]|nr:transcriptional regulator [Spirochaetales bacterium]MBQ2258676.1 transcriptional regulator [Spirochaetales bacterium]
MNSNLEQDITLEERNAYKDIISILLSIDNEEDMEALLDDLLTDKEILDIIDRFLVLDDLYRGKSQRDIASNRKMSLCKITRGSKMLKKKDGFMRRLLSSKYDDHMHI